MKNKLILGGILILGLIVACSTNPFTGKSTMALVPNSQIFPMAFQEYSTFLTQNKVIKNTAESRKIETIGTKIKVAAKESSSVPKVPRASRSQWMPNPTRRCTSTTNLSAPQAIAA